MRKTVTLLLALCLAACSQASKEENLRQGTKLMGEGDLRGAIVHFKNALEKDPNFFEARYELAKVYLETARFEQAEVELKKVSMQSPDFLDTHYLLAKTYINTNRPMEAMEEANRQLARTSRDARSLEILGRAHAFRKNFPDAEKRFQEAIAASPDYLLAKNNLARMYIAIGRLDGARNLLEDAIRRDPKEPAAYILLADLEESEGRNDKALALFERLLKEAPGNGEALYGSGVLYFFKGDMAGVDRCAKRLAEARKDDPDADLLNGLAAFGAQKFPDAIVSLQKSTTKRSRLIGEYFLGLAHFKQKDYEQAVNQFQRCLDLSPDAAQPRVMLALTFLQQKRVDDAIATAKDALARDPENPAAHSVLGDALAQGKRFDEAAGHYDKAAKGGALGARARMKLGLTRFAQGDADAARSELEQSLKVDPDLMESRVVLASSHLRNQNYATAIEVLKKGLTGTPRDALVHSYLAQAYLLQRKIDEAKRHLEAAKAASPQYLAPYINLASLYAAEGENAKALAEYEKALAIAPDNLQLLVSAGRLSGRMGDDKKALAYLQRAKGTGQKESHRPLLAYYLAKKNPEQALALSDEVLASRPDDAAALEDKGRLLSRTGRFEEAQNCYLRLASVDASRAAALQVQNFLAWERPAEARRVAEDAMRSTPDAALGYVLMAGIYKESGDARGALDVLDNAPFTVRDQPRVRMTRAGFLEGMGETQRAVAVYEELLARDPKNVDALFSLAAVCDNRGEKDKASSMYRQVLAQAPDHPYALNNLAYLYADGNDHIDEALVLAVRAYRQMGDDPAVLDTVGYVLHRKGQNEKAREIFEKLVEQRGVTPTLYYHLGLVYKALGQKQSAAKVLKEAVSSGNFAEKDRALSLLEAVSR